MSDARGSSRKATAASGVQPDAAAAIALIDALPRCAKRDCEAPGLLAGVRYAELRYCTPQHRGLSEPRAVSCLVCRTSFAPRLNGRPSVYCSPKCRDRRRADLRKAVAELADRAGPQTADELASMTRRSEQLASYWAHASQDRTLISRQDVRAYVRVHWDGRVPTAISQVEWAAANGALWRAALLRRLSREAAAGVPVGTGLVDLWLDLLAETDDRRRRDAGAIEAGDPFYSALRVEGPDPITKEKQAVAAAAAPEVDS